jgi:hypothetical protein
MVMFMNNKELLVYAALKAIRSDIASLRADFHSRSDSEPPPGGCPARGSTE